MSAAILASDLNASVKTPATIPSLQLWTQSDPPYLFSDSLGTSPAVAGGAAGMRKSLFSGGPNRIQATSAKQGTVYYQTLAGVHYISASSQILSGTAVVLTGKFTIYGTGWRVPSAKYFPAASAAGNALVTDFGNGTVYCFNDAGTPVSAGVTTWPILCHRWRRDASNHVYFRGPGQAEVLLGTLTGTLTLDSEGGVYSVYYDDCTHDTNLIFSDDLVATGDDATVQAYLKTRGFGFGAAITRNMTFEGDSIPHGYNTPGAGFTPNAEAGFRQRMLPLLTYGYAMNDLTVGGNTVANILNTASWNTYGPTMGAGGILCISAGVNDNYTTATANNIATICTDALAAGVPRICLFTGTPHGSGIESARLAFNTSLRGLANGTTIFVADVGGSPLMGQAGDETGSLFDDGLHPSFAGHTYIRDNYAVPTINGMN